MIFENSLIDFVVKLIVLPHSYVRNFTHNISFLETLLSLHPNCCLGLVWFGPFRSRPLLPALYLSDIDIYFSWHRLNSFRHVHLSIQLCAQLEILKSELWWKNGSLGRSVILTMLADILFIVI